MKKQSLAVLSCTLPLLAMGVSPAHGESKIERDNRIANPPNTSQPANPYPTGSSTGSSPVATSPRFTCESVSGQAKVVYRPQSRPNEAYPWAIPSTMGSAWDSQRRCNEIGRRLESYRPDGLQELKIGVENRYNVVCVTTEKNPNCRIVFTVPANQDPVAVRDRVFRNLTLADSGQQTQGVNTFTGGNDNLLGGLGRVFGDRQPAIRTSNRYARPQGIDLRPFLSREDGGFANRIGNPIPVPAQYRLDPDRFR